MDDDGIVASDETLTHCTVNTASLSLLLSVRSAFAWFHGYAPVWPAASL